MNTPRLATGLVAAALLLVGCAGTEQVGSPTLGPSSTTGTTGTTTEPTSSAPPTTTVFPTTAETAIIRIDHIDAGVGGVNSVLSTAVYGDGTVLRPDPEGGWTVGHLADGVVEDLAAQADSKGLLTTVDFGDPGVSDMGWSTMVLTTASGTVEHRVYAPEWEDGLTDEQQQARQNFLDFTSAVVGLDDADLTAPAEPWIPDRMMMTASSGASAEGGEAVAWPGPSDLRSLVGTTGCTVLTGADLAAVVAVLPTENQQGPDAWLLVSTGVPTPAQVVTRSRVLFPHDPGCPEAGDGSDPLPEPWPADDRGAADAWHRWIADQALVGATEDDLLGPDASSTSGLTWYTYQYSVGTVDGAPVIDVVAAAQSSSDRDPERFAVRVDAATGEILDHQVG